MKKIKTTITICSALAFTSIANAQWTAISTFEDAADVDKWTVSTADNNDPADLPRFILQDDPLASGQGQVVAINPGVPTSGGLATSFSTPLPFAFETDESLPIGEAQYYTLFFKIHHPNVEGALGKNNTTIGTIDIDNSEANEFGFLTWPRYNMIFRDGGVGGDNYPEEDNGLPLNSHNGTTYFMPYASATETAADGARMPAADAHAQPDVWYNVWMVANMDDLTAEVYVSGGQFGETARLINIIPNYRNGAAVDHDTILINTSSDGINFPHATFFDDVYATTGKNLELPSPWTVVSNFEDAADVDKWTVSTADNNDPADLPRFILQDDPLASGQGQVVAINPGVPTSGGLATSFSTPLPFAFETDESLPIGEAQYYTLYYKIHHPNVEGALGKNNTTIGTIDIDNSEANEFGFLTWPRYNMIFRDGGVGGDNYPEEDNGLPLNSHNGTTYFMPYASATETAADGARMPAADAHAQPDVWYEVWMVANMDDLTAEVYVSGGQFGETARLINIIPNYRNGAALDHDTILINTSSDGINFPHATFFDDVHVAQGKILSSPGVAPPPPPSWTAVSTFEDAADVDKWTVSTADNNDPADLPRFILQDDPLASGQGKVVAINPGVPTSGGLATSFSTPLPFAFETDESLPIGEAQYYTLFYKIHHPNVEGALGKNNTTIGTIDIDNSEANEFGFLTWPRYNMIFRDGGVGGDNYPEEDNGLPLNSHNGTTYFMPYASATETAADGARMPAADAHAQPDVWYNVWMVANMDDLTAEVYVSGGQFGETARLINIIPNYRNGAALDHDTILINTSSDGINFPHATFFDDVFVTDGKVLTVPGTSVDPPPDTTPRAVGEAIGSTTITLTEASVADTEAGEIVSLDDGTELGKIASIAGQVITLEAPLTVAIPADSVLTFAAEVDTTPRAVGEDAGSTTITMTGDSVAEAEAGQLVFLDDGTEVGKIASIAGQVITLEAALSVAIPAGSALTFVDDNAPDTSGGKFINISTRGTVGVGDDALIGGFVIGEAPQQVVIQAIGQELVGVTGFLVDPVLSIRNSAGEEIGMNDNWQDTQEQLITDLWGGAPPFADGSLSAGGVWTLDPGSYTAIVTGKDDTTGVALIEVYQID